MRFLSRILTSLSENKFVRLYVEKSTFRLSLSLIFGLILNLVYVVFNAIYGIIYGSFWFITVSIYYAMLAAISYAVLQTGVGGEPLDSEKERRTCFVCGALLLLLDVPMTVIMIYTALGVRAIPINSFLLAELTLYSTFTVVRTAYLIVRSRKNDSCMERAGYTVRAVCALMSLFNLSILLAGRGNGSDQFNMFFAIAVSIAVLFFASTLIRCSKREIKGQE